MQQYILDEAGNALACPDLLTWARWYETAERHCADTLVGSTRISTVFLGIDHRFHGDGPPILWETMIFGGPCNEEMDRYSTRAEALAGHERMVDRVRAAQEA